VRTSRDPDVIYTARISNSWARREVNAGLWLPSVFTDRKNELSLYLQLPFSFFLDPAFDLSTMAFLNFKEIHRSNCQVKIY
jgi:hypothetical protein